MMSDPDLSHGSAERLSELLSVDAGEEALWPRSDLEAMLRHQMDSPLLFDLERTDSADSRELVAMTRVTVAPLETFRDLVLHPAPPIGMLLLLNRFAKARGHAGAPVLPRDIASALYYLSVALARVRHGQRISGLDDAALAQGLDWAIGRRWIEPAIRAVYKECKGKIASTG
jgi:hypothetical protein